MRLRGFETRNKAAFQAMAWVLHKVYLLREKMEAALPFPLRRSKDLSTFGTHRWHFTNSGLLVATSGRCGHFGHTFRQHVIPHDFLALTRPANTKRIIHTWRGEKYALQSSAVETPRPFSAHKGHGGGGIFAFHNVVNPLRFCTKIDEASSGVHR